MHNYLCFLEIIVVSTVFYINCPDFNHLDYMNSEKINYLENVVKPQLHAYQNNAYDSTKDMKGAFLISLSCMSEILKINFEQDNNEHILIYLKALFDDIEYLSPSAIRELDDQCPNHASTFKDNSDSLNRHKELLFS